MARIHKPPRAERDVVRRSADVPYTIEIKSGVWFQTIKASSEEDLRNKAIEAIKGITEFLESASPLSKEFVIKLKRAIENGLKSGIRKAGTEQSEILARKTGLLRQAFLSVLNNLITNLPYEIDRMTYKKKYILDIDEFADKLIASVKYARFHIDGRPHHSGDLFYENPTIEGTRPLALSFFENNLFEQINKEITRHITIVEGLG